MEPVSVTAYYNLALSISNLGWPITLGAEGASDEINSLIGTLLTIKFAISETHELLKIREDLDKIILSNPILYKKDLPREIFDRLTHTINRIHHRIHIELTMQEVLIIEKNSVTTSLRSLKNIKDEHEKIILIDVIRCLECGAYRAAIVMGWNLAFEHLRRWIFRSPRKRLRGFNAVLTTKIRSKTRNYDPVEVYEDFYDLSERFLVDVAYEAKLFKKQQHQVLINALTDRNHFAHPSSRRATSATATGYIENLVVNIIGDSNFK